MKENRLKVLLVENDPADVRLIKQMIAEVDEVSLDLEHVDRLSAGLERIAGGGVDVLLLDLGLPDSSGFDTFTRAYGQAREVPIVVLSGLDDTALAKKAVREGAQDYLVKSRLDSNVLMRALCYAIERNKTNKTLQESEQRYRTLAESAQDYIFIISKDMRIQYVSRFTAGSIGCDSEELTGKRLEEVFPPELSDRFKCNLQTVFGSCTPLHIDDKGTFLDKEQWLDTQLIPLKKGNGEVGSILGISRDITERKEAEKRLKETMDMKARFISIVAHELRTPLAAIKESVNLVLDGLAGALSGKQIELLDISRRNVDRLARLVNNALDFQKLEAGKTRFDVKRRDMNGSVKEVYEAMRFAAKKKALSFTVKLQDGLAAAMFDEDKIVQVLNNLVSNAVKFTDKGGITITTTKKEGNIHVMVEDTGIGIKQEDMPKLFYTFEQVNGAEGIRTQGTGLGLAICAEIIKKHEGNIWAESEFRQGSTFHFILPPAE